MKKITNYLLTSVLALAGATAVIPSHSDAHAGVHAGAHALSAGGGDALAAHVEDLRDLRRGSAQFKLTHLSRANPLVLSDDEPTAKEPPAPRLQGQLNINTASSTQWQLLPGVGPAIAGRILAYREKRDFSDPLHLLRVKGIGRKTFAKMRPYLSLKGETTLRPLP